MTRTSGYLKGESVKTMKECILSAVAILAITGLAMFGLKMGHDGTLMLTSIAAIAGLAGYQIGKRIPPK